jgi:hypothetical protein
MVFSKSSQHYTIISFLNLIMLILYVVLSMKLPLEKVFHKDLKAF